MRTTIILLSVVAFIAVSPTSSATVKITAWYRLGDADPGAGLSSVGQDPTLDSSGNLLHLSRAGTPHYSNDVGAAGSAVSMLFSSSTADVYFHIPQLTAVTDNFGLEAWVKSSAIGAGNGESIIAYNGAHGSDGFGLVRAESATPTGGLSATYAGMLGSATVGFVAVPDQTWTHLAIVRDGGTSTFYVKGIPVGSSTLTATAATQDFSVGAAYCAVCGGPNPSTEHLDGWVDEVRLFTFDAGKFNPSDLSDQPIPEPATGMVIFGAMLAAMARRPPRPLRLLNTLKSTH
ncbi:MAG: putative outer rane adhesin like protein [Bryobacterales bacterium]|nr:putative outer rane adhesin like protein [Bryobacterales bacterium]